jgi:hypothetical protein
MPGKARKHKSGSTVKDTSDTLQLLSLPAHVLTQIAEFGLQSNKKRGDEDVHRHPLLGVSQACRDAVFHATKTITSSHRQGADTAQKSADARLLHRACCEASPGLEVSLSVPSWWPDMLSALLRPAICSGGWTKVHALKVRSVKCSH